MNKEGRSHIEIILSFVIFLAAIGIIFYFFEPIDKQNIANPSLDYSMEKFIENVNQEVYKVSVAINDSAENVAVKLEGISEDYFSKAYDLDGNLINSERKGFDVCLDSSSISGKKFAYIFLFNFTGDISENLVCDNYDENDESLYSLGLIDKFYAVSIEKISEYNKTYYEDYDSFRKNIEINTVDFGFSLIYEDKEIFKAERRIPSNFKVYSKSERINIIDAEGNIKKGELIFKVW
jgi:hypothetical protein